MTGIRSVLASRQLRLYYLGNSLSEIGDYALWLAAAVWVRELTGSTARAGLTFMFLSLGTLLAPLTGVLADRFRRRPLVLAVNTATGLAVLSLTTVHRADQVWLIYTVMFLYGVGDSLSTAARTALLPRLVPEAALGSANGLAQALTQGGRLLTPALGVGLLARFGGGAVALLDAATFAAGSVCWLLLRVDETRPEREPSGGRWLPETTAGFRFLFRTPVLRQLTVALAAGIFVIGFYESLGLAVATTGLHHSPSWTGVLVTVMGVTGIVGGLAAGPVLDRLGPGRTAALGLATIGVASLGEAVPVTAVVLTAQSLLGLGLPWIVVGATTAVQRWTPNALLGRVSGADGFLVTAGQAIGIAVGAALISVLYYRDLCYIAAAVLLLTAGQLAFRREQRDADGGGRSTSTAAPGLVVAEGGGTPGG